MRRGPIRAERTVVRYWGVVLLSLAALGFSGLAPQEVLAAPLGASSISSSEGHSCFIDGGQAFCWGDNSSGELGTGSGVSSSSVPVAVDMSGVLAGKTLTQITTGSLFTCALDSSGAAYCWGDNSSGELGDGSDADSTVPVAVDTSGVLAGKILTKISAGLTQACALDTSGAAYCWGARGLGDGNTSTIHTSVPVAVTTSGALAGKTLTQIAASGSYTCALDSAGAAYCWGDNEFGELGDGTTTSSSVPVAVDTTGVLGRV
jgi:alpha-tubulin suppressor-like RCC1 family protein